MKTYGEHGSRSRQRWMAIVWLCLVTVCWSGRTSAGQTPATEQDQQEREQVTVEHGRLSVHLQDADVGKVLAHIGRQANIVLRIAPALKTTISVQFTDVALDQGLRRLLRLASLNYVLVYAQDSTGNTTLQEVRVLGDEQGDASPPSSVAAVRTPPAPPEGEGEEGDTLRNALERLREPAPEAPSGEEDDPAQRLRDALERSGTLTSQPSSEAESDPIHLLRETLAGAPRQEPPGN